MSLNDPKLTFVNNIVFRGFQVDKKEADPETASQGSEKKDPEKTEDDKKPEFCKRLEHAKDECVLQFNQVGQRCCRKWLSSSVVSQRCKFDSPARRAFLSFYQSVACP